MKKILAALLAMTICLSFAACGSSNDENDTGNTRKSESSVPQTQASEADPVSSDTEEEASSAEEEKKEEADSSSADKEEKKETKKKKKKKSDENKGDSLPVGYENDIYTIRFDADKWMDANEFKELIASMASERTGVLDINTMLDGIYYYADDFNKDYPSNILFVTPTYDPSFASMAITDESVADLMIQMVEMQMNAQEGFTVTDSSIVNRAGTDWLRIQIHAEIEDMYYNCDEYVMFHNGYYIIASVNYADASSPAKADFEKMLDNIEFK